MKQIHRNGLEQTLPNITGFNPVNFIELLLKLAGRANGQTVEVTVKKKGEAKPA